MDSAMQDRRDGLSRTMWQYRWTAKPSFQTRFASHLQLMGQLMCTVRWQDQVNFQLCGVIGKTTTRSEETTVTLQVDTVTIGTANTHERHLETDFECPKATCDLSMYTDDGAEIILHYVRLKECHNEVMGPK